MKPGILEKSPKKNSINTVNDENVRYKLNLEYFDKLAKPRSPTKSPFKSPGKEKQTTQLNEDNNVRYKLAVPILKLQPLDVKTIKRSDHKAKTRPKIKVNFWSSKQNNSRLNKTKENSKTNRRHTVSVASPIVLKSSSSPVKVRKRVSFLPSPLFSDNHVPMVTVPDDLTIDLNEEEANELQDDLREAVQNNIKSRHSRLSNSPRSLSRTSTTKTSQTSPTLSGAKRKLNSDNPRLHNNESELEFFSKYIVQKLRRMETNQRIYSENLINTVLMLGQLGTLSGKSKLTDA